MISAHTSVRVRISGGDVAVAHVTYGDGLARIVSRRAAESESDEPDEPTRLPLLAGDRPGAAPRGARLAFVGAAIDDSSGLAHGVNASGLLVGGGGVDSASDETAAMLVLGLLEEATTLDEARALATERLAGTGGQQVELWLAQAGGAVTMSLAGDLQVRADPDPVDSVGGIDDVLATLRKHGDGGPGDDAGSWCRHGQAGRTMSVLVARLTGTRPAMTLLAPGPPCCGVFVRYWPGIEIGPDSGGTVEQPSRAASLTGQLGALVAAEPDRLVAVRRHLADAEVQSLAEGEAAERMAALMDGDGDDRGAEVRRVVAQVYALDIALRAIGEAVTEGSGLGATL